MKKSLFLFIIIGLIGVYGTAYGETFFSEDFNDGDISDWNQTKGIWNANNGYLVCDTSYTGTDIQKQLSINSNSFTIEFDTRIPVLDCRGAAIRIQNIAGDCDTHTSCAQVVLGIATCEPWGGGSNITVKVKDKNYTGASNQEHSSPYPWTKDTEWHNIKLVINKGVFSVYLDGTAVVENESYADGDDMINASYITFPGWQHSTPGNEYDNIKIYTNDSESDLGSWSTLSDMPTIRYSHEVIEVNGKFYLIGGMGTDHVLTNLVYEYDPVVNTYTEKAALPTVRGSFASGVLSGKIYICGGNVDGYTSKVEAYDPVTNTWTEKASLPASLDNPTGAVINGKLYVIGGFSGGFRNTVYEYDPCENLWTTKTAMPTARACMASCVVNGKLYVIGGNSGSVVGTVEVYDPATDSWETKASMPTGHRYHSSSVLNGKIYVFGGYLPDGSVVDDVFRYDPATDTWTVLDPMPIKKWGHSSVVYNDKIYLFGGVTYTTELLATQSVTVFSTGADNNDCESGLLGDINGDGKIGLEEAIYALKVVSGLGAKSTQHQLIPNGFLTVGNQWNYSLKMTEYNGSPVDYSGTQSWSVTGTEVVKGYSTFVVQRTSNIVGIGSKSETNYWIQTSEYLAEARHEDDEDYEEVRNDYPNGNPWEFLPVYIADTANNLTHGQGEYAGALKGPPYYTWTGSNTYKSSFLGTEAITVPAGTFSCVKVHVRNDWVDDSGWHGFDEMWFWTNKDTGIVKMEIYEVGYDNNNNLDESSRIILELN